VRRKTAGDFERVGAGAGFDFTTTLLLTNEVRAGMTAIAEAQIVTLDPFTCDPTELLPLDPPEFLQAANDGSGANTKREIISPKPTNELILNWGFMRAK
jgi:hypothetical protein